MSNANIPITEVKKLIKNALKNAFEEANKGNIDDAKLKSSIFVSNVGRVFNNEYNNMNNYRLKVVGYDSNNRKRTPGEWLLDVIIAKEMVISDQEKDKSEAKILYQIIWAIESESNSSLPAFAEDFGKLMCVKSENYLYLNGLQQKTSNGHSDYIKRRTKTAKQCLDDANIKEKNFYIAFWPSPARRNGSSLWDKEISDLLEMVKVEKL